MSTATLPDIYKVGSTWVFALTRKDASGVAIDLTGLAVRAMFRSVSAAGPVIVTLTDTGGIAVDAAAGQVVLTLTPAQTVLFTPGSKAVFDVEMSSPGYAWQSSTYRFKTEAEVTRDG